MERNTEELIKELDDETNWFIECRSKDLQEVGLRYRATANVLRQFRDTLISIALCQNGVPSHQAQESLKNAGYCYHFNSVYRYREEKGHEGSTWICHDCQTESDKRPVPYR